jgi:hypothetical protein
MTMQVFLMLLLAISILVSLTVEALKKMFNNKISSNIVAAIVSVIISIGVGICYYIITGIAFNSQFIVCLIALIFLSWLCAMLGYDKVVQALRQLKGDV